MTTLSSFGPQVHALIQGASRGIGLGYVEALLALPQVALLFATCREPAHAEALQALKQKHPKRLHLLALDVTQEATIVAAAEAVAAHTKTLHLLINNTGILHDEDGLKPEKRLADIDPVLLHKSFAVNAFGPILVAKHFASFFYHREHAVFANMSARVGSIGDNRLGGWYAYRASKAAQNMFLRSLSIELVRRAKSTICVALHPGTTDTELSAPFQRGVPPEKLFSVEQAVGYLLGVVNRLTPEDNGAFFAWDGQPIPW